MVSIQKVPECMWLIPMKFYKCIILNGTTMNLMEKNKSLSIPLRVKMNDSYLNYEHYIERMLSAVLMNEVPELRLS